MGMESGIPDGRDVRLVFRSGICPSSSELVEWKLKRSWVWNSEEEGCRCGEGRGAELSKDLAEVAFKERHRQPEGTPRTLWPLPPPQSGVSAPG